ncbi:YIP1 family protein [Natranaerofaba carboxydovora]|uniref:YIP1 family protein n=1 Tax=Natranaerofaba carboxydovora TaxID=2742683 RepID=UPI001F1431D9|nr:YIP1 family protein [Natranaerofaba carboxydovora]UMZ74618.1 hypothetical protein ACONDI_02215 [Natranaerofaba carboxydovora]
MFFLTAMIRVLKLDEEIFREIQERNLALRYTTINFVAIALIYSLTSIFLNPQLFEELSTIELFLVQGLIIGAGIFVVFIIHFGAALLVWAFTRALGAHKPLSLVYTNTGVALIPLWVAMPGLAAVQAGIAGAALFVFTILASAYVALTFFVATKSASGLSYLKMALVTLGLAIYLVSFLYLWMVQ